jgi:hypothetical protein
MDGQPIRTEINNGVLSSTNAMPLKNLTSDNTQSFSNNRQLFQNAYQPPVNYSLRQTTRSFFQRSTGALPHGYVVDGPKSVFQKKWIGGNRDASQTAMRRRMNSTGASMTATRPQSFKNPNDNNPRIEALARVRGGGACVPPKVTQRLTVPYRNTSGSFLYRIISAGLSAYSGGVVSWSGSTAFGQAAGFYTYTPTQQTTIANTISNTFVRSYNVMTIDRTTGTTTTRAFDVFGIPDPSQSPALVTYLNALSSSVIVVIATFDEPQTAGTGPLPIPSDMITAIKRCGGSSDFGSTTGTPAGILQYRSAYILIGIPGIGTGNGIQRYKGASSSDTTAVLDVRFSVFGGQYTIISG